MSDLGHYMVSARCSCGEILTTGHICKTVPVGWLCPKCGRGNSPFLTTCECGPDVTVSTASATTWRMKLVNDISRRAQVQHRTELETEIDNIIGRIEDLGAHEKLTDAVVNLHDAFNALADWEDMDRPGAAERP